MMLLLFSRKGQACASEFSAHYLVDWLLTPEKLGLVSVRLSQEVKHTAQISSLNTAARVLIRSRRPALRFPFHLHYKPCFVLSHVQKVISSHTV